MNTLRYKTIEVYNIEYDLSDVEGGFELPSALTYEVLQDFDCENNLADAISQETGVLVLSCQYEVALH